MNPESLETFALESEAWLRLGCFGLVFAAMSYWELKAPKRDLTLPRRQRWLPNIALFVINSLVLRLLFPAAAVGLAVLVAERGWGLFNQVALPFWLEVLSAVLLLDLAIYLQHRLMHRMPLLWRLHCVHHADLDIDLTTGSRFHTLEILFSMLVKGLVIALLGPALLAVLIFELLLNGMAVFNHANVRIPEALDRWLRLVFVTPDVHRVHHSVIARETDSNFGFNLSIWDRCFGTYIAQPEAGHTGMRIGLNAYRDPRKAARLPGMLMLPFERTP